jgi:hypothetical protein
MQGMCLKSQNNARTGESARHKGPSHYLCEDISSSLYTQSY